MDMHSGGGSKENYDYIFIEAPEEEAIKIFTNRFGHHPSRVTCDCCGDDYAISESDSLQQATAYERNCEYSNGGYLEQQKQSLMDIRRKYPTADSDTWGLYMPLEEYLKSNQCLVIYSKDIKPEERK